MVVEYKGIKTVFDDKWVSNVSYDEFEAVCLDSKTFKLMLKKERINKIKELYDNIGASKKCSKDKHSKDVRTDNRRKRKGDIGDKQEPARKGEEHQESKDKAEVQKRTIRKEETEIKP